MEGKIIKGIAGFYYVHTQGHIIYECKAKGIFRKENIKPLVGDNVHIDILDNKEKSGNIIEILNRNNNLVRPAVANIDQALVVFSIKQPNPNLNLLDRFLIMIQRHKIDVAICFNKLDLSSQEEMNEIVKIYENCGYKVFRISVKEREGLGTVQEFLSNKTTALAGPSGVGKSSLINCLQSDIVMETSNVSVKIGRGKHTTRHTQLMPINDKTYIMDTPGFSSMNSEDIEKEELKHYFPEFDAYEGKCRFLGCTHIHEPDCAVKDALKDGHVSQSRYDNYCLLFDERKETRRY